VEYDNSNDELERRQVVVKIAWTPTRKSRNRYSDNEDEPS
jgi:hypothetical protein